MECQVHHPLVCRYGNLARSIRSRSVPLVGPAWEVRVSALPVRSRTQPCRAVLSSQLTPGLWGVGGKDRDTAGSWPKTVVRRLASASIDRRTPFVVPSAPLRSRPCTSAFVPAGNGACGNRPRRPSVRSRRPGARGARRAVAAGPAAGGRSAPPVIGAAGAGVPGGGRGPRWRAPGRVIRGAVPGPRRPPRTGGCGMPGAAPARRWGTYRGMTGHCHPRHAPACSGERLRPRTAPCGAPGGRCVPWAVEE